MRKPLRWFGRAVMVAVLAVAWAGTAVADDLTDAAKRRDGATVRTLIEQGADVNTPQPDGATALHWAAHWDDLETVRLLVEEHANVNAANEYGVTPLTLAVADAGPALVEFLLQAGANPNAALPSGETPLMTATRVNAPATVTALIARGADVKAQERSHGQTALMWAFARGHIDIARALIEQGADIHARSNSGFTPLLFATRHGDLEGVRFLLAQGADVNETARDGSSVLHVATVRAHVELAELLLARGADPNADGPGYTPLHWAAGTWDSVTTNEYIESPPQTKGWSDEWRTLIGLQGARKHRLVRSLLARGADPNVKTTASPPRFGYSFQSFVDAGGSLASATPFMLAAMAGDAPTMRLLLEGGADPLITTEDGTTALMVASGMTSIEEEMSAPENKRLEAVKLALDLGVDINATNTRGNTALHATALLGFPRIARYLVAERGAAVNPLNKVGETPLRVAEGTIINAMFFIHDKVADVLLSLGGTSDGSGVCTPGILKSASVESKSTLCETAPPAETSAEQDQP
jgi:ankyrin repeat protein